MWWILILIISIFLIRFFYTRNKQAQKIAREGGMLHKYRTLIEIISSGDSRVKIYKVTSDSVLLGLSNIGGSTMFYLTQTFGHISVQWKVDSPILGKQSLEWDFDEYLDQEKMFEKINNDITKYQNNMMTAKGFPEL